MHAGMKSCSEVALPGKRPSQLPVVGYLQTSPCNTWACLIWIWASGQVWVMHCQLRQRQHCKMCLQAAVQDPALVRGLLPASAALSNWDHTDGLQK